MQITYYKDLKGAWVALGSQTEVAPTYTDQYAEHLVELLMPFFDRLTNSSAFSESDTQKMRGRITPLCKAVAAVRSFALYVVCVCKNFFSRGELVNKLTSKRSELEDLKPVIVKNITGLRMVRDDLARKGSDTTQTDKSIQAQHKRLDDAKNGSLIFPSNAISIWDASRSYDACITLLGNASNMKEYQEFLDLVPTVRTVQFVGCLESSDQVIEEQEVLEVAL